MTAEGDDTAADAQGTDYNDYTEELIARVPHYVNNTEASGFTET